MVEGADAAPSAAAAATAGTPAARGSPGKVKRFAGLRGSFAAMMPSSRLHAGFTSQDTDAESDDDDAASSAGSMGAGPSRMPSRRRVTRDRSSSLPSISSAQRPDFSNVVRDDYNRDEGGDFVPSSALIRINSMTPSLQVQVTPRQMHPRGFAWRADQKGKGGFVPPSHRNPTAQQAFADTHFGSSSNWRTIRRPFAGAASIWNKHNPLSRKRDKYDNVDGPDDFAAGLANSGTEHGDRKDHERTKSLASRLGLNSITPSIFGMSTAPAPPQDSKEKAPVDPNTYEPELIPTTHRDPLASYYFKKLQGNVVVLGGYRGSVLRDAATHQMLWVPLKVGVGLRRPTLELGLGEEHEEDSEQLVYADDMLSEIGSMVDSGRRLIQRCSSKRTNVYSFGYDWRLSLGRSSKRLEAFLYRLWEESAVDPSERRGAKVIAHSMGGLVALHALSQSKMPQIFESLVFASTPFLGTSNILGPLRIGDVAMFNEEICSPRATFTFRSTFYLLPNDHDSDKDVNDKDVNCTAAGRCFEEEDGTFHDIDFLSPDTWNDLGFSPCVEAGTRPRLVANGRTSGQGTATQNGAHYAANADAQQAQRTDKADRGPALPGADLQLTSSDNDTSAHVAEGVKEAVKVGQELGMGRDDTDTALLPENRQDDESKEAATDRDAKENLSAKWQYLERTLAEVKQFVYELRTSFDENRFLAGHYPPMAILTSGRTPTVRGALTWPHEDDDKTKKDHWKETVRRGDYSRMLYAPGDGVILRRSSVTMPGQWGRCLVRGSDDAAKDRATIAAVRSLSRHRKYDELDTLDLNLTSSEGTVETGHRHVTLLSDVSGVGRCLEACRRARQARAAI